LKGIGGGASNLMKRARKSNTFKAMAAINLETLCTTVQQKLSELAGDNYPAMKREPTGFLDAVVSDVNRSGFTTTYMHDDGGGKLMQVVREWAQPVPYTDTVDEEQSVCESGTEEGRILDVVQITQYTGSRVMEFSESELRTYCEQPSDVQTMRIAQHIGGVMRKLNQKLIAQYLTQVGNSPMGNAPGSVTLNMLYNDGVTEQLIPDGEVRLMEDMADIGVVRPIVVGSGIVSRYARLAAIGCCNDYGQDVTNLAGSFAFYRDRDVAIVADDEGTEIIVWNPGAVQLSTYNKYRGEFRRVVENHYAHDTMVDPVTGLTLDMKWKYDDCAEKWRLQFGVHHELHLLPNTMFKAADERNEINYAFLYQGGVLTPAP
jgi:hypothetical protein